MVLPPGHAHAIRSRHALSHREKWMIGGVLATVAAVVIALIIALSTAGKSSANGCIYATIPGVVGAVQVNECGASARSSCASVFAPGAYTRGAARTIVVECRKAGLPVN